MDNRCESFSEFERLIRSLRRHKKVRWTRQFSKPASLPLTFHENSPLLHDDFPDDLCANSIKIIDIVARQRVFLSRSTLRSALKRIVLIGLLGNGITSSFSCGSCFA